MNMTENTTLDYALRALQVLFAFIVMGTDGYAIHVFRGHTDYTHIPEGDFYLHTGVPNAWGFLMFCAAWSVLAVIFHFSIGAAFTNRAWIGYTRVAVEAVAVLSWFAGFIAVAVNISTGTCSQGTNSCRHLQAAAVFGAFEWLLFMATAGLTAMLVFRGSHTMRVSKTKPGAAV